MDRLGGGRHRLDLGWKAYRRLRRQWRTQMPAGIATETALAAGWRSAFGRLQRAVYDQSLCAARVDSPIFIVGHWRSGTTLLHELICADPQFAFPSTQACMNPHYFLFAAEAEPSRRAVIERPMDGLAITAASPQEDEFALLCLGALSPYEAFLFPDGIADVVARCDVDLLEPAERACWERTFLGFLAAVGVAGRGRRLVLKSPPHSMRIPALLRMFPGRVLPSCGAQPGGRLSLERAHVAPDDGALSDRPAGERTRHRGDGVAVDH